MWITTSVSTQRERSSLLASSSSVLTTLYVQVSRLTRNAKELRLSCWVLDILTDTKEICWTGRWSALDVVRLRKLRRLLIIPPPSPSLFLCHYCSFRWMGKFLFYVAFKFQFSSNFESQVRKKSNQSRVFSQQSKSIDRRSILNLCNKIPFGILPLMFPFKNHKWGSQPCGCIQKARLQKRFCQKLQEGSRICCPSKRAIFQCSFPKLFASLELKNGTLEIRRQLLMEL